MFSAAVNEARFKSARYERNFPLRCNLGISIGWFLLEGDVYSYKYEVRKAYDRKNEMPNGLARIIASESNSTQANRVFVVPSACAKQIEL